MAGTFRALMRPIARRRDLDSHAGITELRPTLRGAITAALTFVLIVLEIISGHTGIFLVVVVVGLPLVVGPFFVNERARRATSAQVRMMVSPPLVPVGGHAELTMLLANEAECTLPPVGLQDPASSWAPEGRWAGSRPPGQAGWSLRWAGHRYRPLAADPQRLLRWIGLGPNELSSSVLNLPTDRRGVFKMGPLTLWVHDPFGLFGLPVGTAAPALVVVHPRAAPSETRPTPRTAGLSPEMPIMDSTSGPDDAPGELVGLRPYVPGDRLHLLSWPAEARYGSLMVRQFSAGAGAPVRIVLDDRAGVHRREAFERALSVVHAFVSEAVDCTANIEIGTLSGRRMVVPATPEGMVGALTFLARTDPRRIRMRGTEGAPPSRSPHHATVITTSTGQDTLPALSGNPRIVVVA